MPLLHPSDTLYNTWSSLPNRSERLGQYFVNRYIKGQWPSLFYEEDTQKAYETIHRWLEDNHYWYTLPPQLSTCQSSEKNYDIKPS